MAKLHGKALHLAEEVQRLFDKKGDSAVSRRACRKRLAVLVYEMATQTNVEPRHFADYAPDSIVVAIARERTRAKLVACGAVSITSRIRRPKQNPGGGRRSERLAPAA